MIDHLPVRIRGKQYTPRKLTMIKKRYIFPDDVDEVLFCPPIPLLIVEAERPVVFTIAERSTGVRCAQDPSITGTVT